MDMVALRKVKAEPPPKPTKKPKKEKTAKADHASLFDRYTDEFVPNNCEHETVPLVLVTTPTQGEQQGGLADRHRIEASIKNEVLRTQSDLASRFLQVHGTVRVPDGPFAAPLIECVEQFQDGHYFGCIALSQAVLEAIIGHIWQIKLKKKPNQESRFDKNLEALHKKKLLSDEWMTKLAQMWADRHAVYYFRPSAESDQQKIEEAARNALKMLKDLDREFFEFSVRDGMVVPAHPEYWSIKESESLALLRAKSR